MEYVFVGLVLMHYNSLLPVSHVSHARETGKYSLVVHSGGKKKEAG